MNTKKILLLALSGLILFNLILLPTSAITPRWLNTRRILIQHENISGTAWCEVQIAGKTGTTKIDNINITLSRISGTAEIPIAKWENLSVTGSTFNFFEGVDNVPTGYLYRLSITANVHKDGFIEEIEDYSDTEY